MSAQMEAHLRTYVEDGIQQKVRLGNTLNDYKDQEHKTRERIIDQADLKAQLEAAGIDPAKIALVVERSERDKNILTQVQNIIAETQGDMNGLTMRLNAHLEELSALSITSGGFITHTIGTDEHTTLDKDTKIVSFQAGGHIEIPIAVRLNKWKDSSQLTIKKIKS